ncbi:MAG: NAD(P)H-hydrate dehydratase [Thermofilum sp.]
MKVASAEDIRRIDREAAELYGLTSEILMEHAGAAVARLIENVLGAAGSLVVVVAGPGHNGGDGLVAARVLHSMGAEVEVFVVGEEGRLAELTRLNLERVRRAGIPARWVSEESLEELAGSLAEADVVVDALFGVGLKRPLEGLYKRVVELINESGALVVSVDVPSGIDADTGQVLGVAVSADYTVACGLPKLGNLIYPGAEHSGLLCVARLSYPPQLLEDERIKVETNDPLPLPPRRPDTHKGDYGKALFVAGAAGYLGAPYLASMSFLKAGGGYSRLATVRSIVPHLGSRGSEVVYIPLEETPSGSIAYSNLPRLLELAEQSDIVAVGPGLSTSEETLRLAADLVSKVSKPVIVDGDGITAVARKPECVKSREAPTILTPHLGEMSRLTGLSVEEVKRDKVSVLRRAAADFNAVIVLKGAHTLIGTPDGRVYVNLTGNPGMATAGSGDVLTGTIAAMHGLGLGIVEAARMGVFVHGLAGDLAAEALGEDGVTASAIMRFLPKAMRMLREEFEEVLERYTIPVL